MFELKDFRYFWNVEKFNLTFWILIIFFSSSCLKFEASNLVKPFGSLQAADSRELSRRIRELRELRNNRANTIDRDRELLEEEEVLRAKLAYAFSSLKERDWDAHIFEWKDEDKRSFLILACEADVLFRHAAKDSREMILDWLMCLSEGIVNLTLRDKSAIEKLCEKKRELVEKLSGDTNGADLFRYFSHDLELAALHKFLAFEISFREGVEAIGAALAAGELDSIRYKSCYRLTSFNSEQKFSLASMAIVCGDSEGKLFNLTTKIDARVCSEVLDAYGNNALLLSAAQNRRDLFDKISASEYSNSLSCANAAGQNSLSIAIRCQHNDLVGHILNNLPAHFGLFEDPGGNEALGYALWAQQNGNVTAVRFLIAQGLCPGLKTRSMKAKKIGRLVLQEAANILATTADVALAHFGVPPIVSRAIEIMGKVSEPMEIESNERYEDLSRGIKQIRDDYSWFEVLDKVFVREIKPLRIALYDPESRGLKLQFDDLADRLKKAVKMNPKLRTAYVSKVGGPQAPGSELLEEILKFINEELKYYSLKEVGEARSLNAQRYFHDSRDAKLKSFNSGGKYFQCYDLDKQVLIFAAVELKRRLDQIRRVQSIVEKIPARR